jgi:hypothetical protein
MTNLELSLYSCICTFPPEERLASSLPTAIIGAWFLGKAEFCNKTFEFQDFEKNFDTIRRLYKSKRLEFNF